MGGTGAKRFGRWNREAGADLIPSRRAQLKAVTT